MNLYLADIFTNQTLQYITLDAIESVTIKSELGTINQLNVKLSKKYPKIVQQLINNVNIGIRIKDYDKTTYNPTIDQIFRMTNEAQIETSETIELILFSSLYNLSYTKPIYGFNQGYTGSALALIQSLDNNFEFGLIGKDKAITLNTGVLSNFDLCKEIVKQAGWQFLQRNIKYSLTQSRYINSVELGNFENKSINRFITNMHQYNRDIIITDYKRKVTVQNIKYIEMIGDTGKGTNTTTSLNLGSNTVITDPLYPITEINGRYYIYNTFYTASSESYKSVVAQNTSVQGLYEQGVNFLKASNNPYVYDLSLVSKSYVLAGERVQVKYRSKEESFDLVATVKSSEFTFGSGVCKFELTQAPTVVTESGATKIFQEVLGYVKSQQYQPQN